MSDEVRYRHDYSGLRTLAVGAEMHQHLIDVAFEAKAFAVSISPDAPPYGEGYITAFEVDGVHTERHNGLRRAMAYLRNTSEHAVFVELGNGTGKARGHHVLSRTADWIENS